MALPLIALRLTSTKKYTVDDKTVDSTFLLRYLILPLKPSEPYSDDYIRVEPAAIENNQINRARSLRMPSGVGHPGRKKSHLQNVANFLGN